MIVEVRIRATEIPPDSDPLIELIDQLEEVLGDCLENGVYGGFRFMAFRLKQGCGRCLTLRR